MFYNLCYYFVIFFAISVAGWCVETIYCSIIERKINLNRGFLIGPYIPIYGCGGLLSILLLNRYYDDPLVVYILALVSFSALEYFTSYLMEKLFNARWWDYSHLKYNINGRIELTNSFLFGLMGLVLIYGVNPFFSNLLKSLSENTLEMIAIILFIIFAIDFIVSFVLISRLKITTRKLKDSTNEISEQVREEIQKNHFLKKRLLDAFPRMKTHYGDKIMDIIRKSVYGVGAGFKKVTDREKAKRKKKKTK